MSRDGIKMANRQLLKLHLMPTYRILSYNIVHKHVVTAASCPERWHYYNESCFYVSLTKTNQPSARSECLAMGGDLASISDQAEYDFVISISLELAVLYTIFVNIIRHTPHKLWLLGISVCRTGTQKSRYV